ncbi:MAG: hypothetical protein ABIR32_13590 [Ilumatobacteraceae bacterium]
MDAMRSMAGFDGLAIVAKNSALAGPILVLVVVIFIVSLVADRKTREKRHEQARQIAADQHLIHDLSPPTLPDVRLKLLPRGSYSDVLRAADRPETLFGSVLVYRSGKTTISRIVALCEITDSVPHLSFRRSNILSSLDPNDIEIGDVAFDDRWSIKCDDPGFIQWLLASTNVSRWLGQFEDNASAPSFEANGRHVVVSMPGRDLARVPGVIEWARTFAELIQPRPLPPPAVGAESPRA